MRRAAGGEKRAIERGERGAAGGGAARGEPTQTATGETVRVVLLRCGGEERKTHFVLSSRMATQSHKKMRID